MSYAQTLANALEAEGIPTTRADGTALNQEELVNAFITKHEKKGSQSSPQKPSGKESGQARKHVKVSVDASGTTKADFFAEHRDEVKKVHKSAADCRKELLRMWNEHLKKKPEKSEKDGKKKAVATATTTSPKPQYHKFDEALSDDQASEWNLKKIGVMGEKHVYVDRGTTTPAPSSAAKFSAAKKEKETKKMPTMPTPTGNKRKFDDAVAADPTSLAIDQITSWLMSLDQPTLKLTAAKIGKPTSGTKKDLVDHILNDMKAAKISDKLIAQKKSKTVAAASAAMDVDDDDDSDDDDVDDADVDDADADDAESEEEENEEEEEEEDDSEEEDEEDEEEEEDDK